MDQYRQAAEAPNILIVEDDSQIADMLRASLVEHGMFVEIAENSLVMDTRMKRVQFDLVVLDIMLPGEDGLSICRRLRSAGDIPILMLTSVTGDIDRVVGLELGADDYVTKPFVLRELIARIKGLLRRANATSSKPRTETRRLFCFDGWQIDPVRRQVHDPSRARVAMTANEFDLLLAFCRNSGCVLTREQLLAVTHAGLAGPDDRSIDVHISRLRQKIEADSRDPMLIKTVRLGGYIFTATVDELDV